MEKSKCKFILIFYLIIIVLIKLMSCDKFSLKNFMVIEIKLYLILLFSFNIILENLIK